MDTIFNLTSCVFLLFLSALILDIFLSRLLLGRSLTKQRVASRLVWSGAIIAYIFIVFKTLSSAYLSKNEFIYFCIHVLSLCSIQFALQSTVWIYIDTLMPCAISSRERSEVRIWGSLLSIVISIGVLVVCLGANDACFATVGMIMVLIGLLFWALADTLCFADRLYSNYKNQTEVIHKAMLAQLRHQFTLHTPVVLGSMSITKGWFLLLPIITVSIASVFFILALSWLQIIHVEMHALRHLDLFVSIVFPVFAASAFAKGGRGSDRKIICSRTLSWFIGLIILVLAICRFINCY